MNCLSCNSKCELVYDFGLMPLVNSFYTDEDIHLEKKYPLELYVCTSCFLMQIGKAPDPSEVYTEYHHLSSASQGNRSHLESVAAFIKNNFGSDLKVLEIGANDLYLTNLLKENPTVLAVDPAKNINKDQKNLIRDFFNLESSKKIKTEYGDFDLIIGLNVFAHNEDFKNMFLAAKSLMHDDSILMVEVAYALETICDGNFDTIYHEHVCSYSLLSLENLFNDINLKINYVEKLDTQGGSLRLLISKNSKLNLENNLYNEISKNEKRLGLDKIDFYKNVSSQIKRKIENLNNFVTQINDESSALLILGAPARGVITLNSISDIEAEVSIIDDTIFKQDKLMPGVHFKIHDWDIDLSKFTNCLILSWNYSQYLNEKLIKKGFNGKVFVPFPEFLELETN